MFVFHIHEENFNTIIQNITNLTNSLYLLLLFYHYSNPHHMYSHSHNIPFLYPIFNHFKTSLQKLIHYYNLLFQNLIFSHLQINLKLYKIPSYKYEFVYNFPFPSFYPFYISPLYIVPSGYSIVPKPLN